MLAETGEVVRFDGDSVWVRTIRHSVCGSCQARIGCGQRLLNQLVGVSADIRVRLNPSIASEINKGDLIEIGIEEGAIVAASILAYGVPLLSLILSIVLAEIVGASGVALLLLCVIGLGAGVLVARFFLASRFRSGFFEPVFVRKILLGS
jgi:sigma-E factor negative regulatory protein RseC